MFFYKKGAIFYRKRQFPLKKCVFIKFKDFWVKNHTDFMTKDICKYIEKYILIELLCVIASHTITQPDHTTCTVWALHKPAVR